LSFVIILLLIFQKKYTNTELSGKKEKLCYDKGIKIKKEIMKETIIPAIFKAYDIRGLYPKEINKNVAYNIGRALVQFTGAKKIVVGIDMRTSSLEIEKGLIAGIIKQGADVIKIGLATTPMLYFAAWNLSVEAAVMVTASHNPAEWNGLKLCHQGTIPIGEGTGMEDIKDLAITGNFSKTDNVGVVTENKKLKGQYLDYMSKFFQAGKAHKKIVVDFANAVGSLDKAVFDKFPSDLEMTYLYAELDGTFPHHEANPLKLDTLKDLQAEVLKQEADLGIAYDGDADRIGFVDEKGEIVRMDFITAILAGEILKKQPGELILADIRSSNSVLEFIEKAGGKVHHCRIGHSLIKAQMKKEGAIFAGELSGHYFFQENNKAEMTTLAALIIINRLNETGEKLSDLVADLKKYFQSGEINSEVVDKEKVLKQLKEKYQDGRLNELDGIRIDYSDWWFNVRPSNTEPKLRLNLEAKSQKLMEEKRDEVLAIIRAK